MQPFTDYFVENYLASTESHRYTPDLVFRSGATTGGTDLAARIVNHVVPAFTIGQTLLFIDTSIIVFAAFVFKSVQLALYAMVTLYISQSPFNLLRDLDRGVTALKGKGMFTGSDKEVLFCVVQRRQIPMVKKIVRQIDKKALKLMNKSLVKKYTQLMYKTIDLNLLL